MLQKLRTIVYQCSDLTAAKDWYSRVTGVKPYFDEPFYVGFDINGFELGLDPCPEKPEEGNHSVAYWQVASVRESVDHFLSAGATLIQDVTNVGGAIQVATVADPFGNYIGLIEGA